MAVFIVKAFEIGRSANVAAALSVLRRHYPVMSTDPLMVALSVKRGQYLLLARYGAMALSNWSPALEEKAKNLILPFVDSPSSAVEYVDEIKVAVDRRSRPEVLFDKVIIPRMDDKFILVIGSLLMQSAGLESYEKKVDLLLGDLNKELEKLEKPRFFLAARDFVAKIIKMTKFRQEIVANIGILDKPDLAWDDADLDLLYSRLAEEFELQPRTKILAEKIDFLKDSMKNALDILNAHKSYILEVAIVALFVIDILLYFF